jgi:acetamidase/formamidase
MEHIFSPTRYHATIGSHEPELTVASGDTIVTTTIDAGGWDANCRFIGPPGNPQTGPIYVEGAESGDALKVTFDGIWPNRAISGFSSPRIAPHVLEPGDPNMMTNDERLTFRIDFEDSTATVANGPSGLADLTVPIQPMLGCFGVAPARGQAISTATSGPYGGNMDYKGFAPGVTAYLPVFVEGALFHLGDGHAWQADGEILGTGIETSMDVTVSLEVIKGKEVGWPRGENDDHIFTVGNARPLDQATQHASSEMLRWLQSDYGLNAAEANFLLGMHVEYDVGNLVDPAFTMVCKLSKSVLPSP